MENAAFGSLAVPALVIAGLAGAGWWWLRCVRYVALGDSLAAGVGSVLFVGYPRRLAVLLGRRWRRLVLLRNLGRFGWTSGQLLDALRTDAPLRAAVAGARLISVDIGGNDLHRCAEDPACLEQAVAEYRRNWEAIWAEVRRLNPGALAVCMDLYNPYPPEHPRHALANQWIAELNRVTADPDVHRMHGIHGMARVYAAFQGRECEYAWACRIGDIHPTDHGHQAIAEAFAAVLPPAPARRR